MRSGNRVHAWSVAHIPHRATGTHQGICALLISVRVTIDHFFFIYSSLYLDTPRRGLVPARAPETQPTHFAGAGRVGREVPWRAVDGIGRGGVELVKLGCDGRRDFLCMKEWEERVETWIMKTASQMRASTHVPGFVPGLITFFFFINHQFLTSNTCSDIADFFGANVACGKRDQK